MRWTAALGALVCAPLIFLACQTNARVRVSNPTDGTLSVQINERAPFELAAGQTVSVALPALERLQPISIVAQDERGRIVYSSSLTSSALSAAGNQVVLSAAGRPAYDPLVAH